MEKVKLVFAQGDVRIELEGEATWVKQEFETLLKLANGTEPPKPASRATTDADPPSKASTGRTIRNFVNEKMPRNVYEKIACVLYFARENEGKPELSITEIRDHLRAAGVKPPGAMLQALVDSRSRYSYVEAGTQRGIWKLAPNGETQVEFDLPPKPKA